MQQEKSRFRQRVEEKILESLSNITITNDIYKPGNLIFKNTEGFTVMYYSWYGKILYVCKHCYEIQITIPQRPKFKNVGYNFDFYYHEILKTHLKWCIVKIYSSEILITLKGYPHLKWRK